MHINPLPWCRETVVQMAAGPQNKTLQPLPSNHNSASPVGLREGAICGWSPGSTVPCAVPGIKVPTCPAGHRDKESGLQGNTALVTES